MKKKLAALLCALMSITAFTGCSQAELSYLQMSIDMLQGMKIMEAEGTINVSLNADEMKNFVSDVAVAAGYDTAQTTEALSVMDGFSGSKTVALDYSMRMDTEDLSYYLAMDASYNGKSYDLGDMYFDMTNGIYVSTDMIVGIYQLMADEADTNSYMKNAAFITDLDAALGEGYVALIDAEDLAGAEEVMPEGGFGDLYADVYEFYKNSFEGFTTGMVTEVSGGYRIQANGDDVAKLVVDLIDFIGNNPDTFFGGVTEYMMATMDTMNVPAEDKEAFEAEMAEVAADTAEIKATMDEVKAIVEEAIAMPAVAKVLDGFSYDATVTGSGSSYTSKESYTIKNGSAVVMEMTTEGTVKATNNAVTMPANAVSADTVTEKITVVEDKYNPVTGASVMWGFGETDAILTSMRNEVSLLSNDTDITQCIVEDGRAYLPLRMICDVLGETVEWNNAEKTAYVVQGEEKIAMKGIIQDGRTYIAVRDFEKLGYTVGYESVDGVREATIVK